MTESVLVPGNILGRYELLLPIAKGGMAQVWAARLLGTRGFRKVVAIKTILSGAIDDSRMEHMFLEEATLASQIHHPNVVETLELGEQDGTLYLVMEWVDGEPLNYIVAHAAQRGGIPLPIAVNIVGQACKGLHAAHDLRDDGGTLLGVVHRDISPQNVLVTYSGTTKLVDFGIAKATARSSALTEAGEVKGKFAYMSPEQVSGKAIDRRSDIFAMGVLLYMLTTGRHPFKGEHAGETVRNICSDDPATAPTSFLPDYPVALEAVLMTALSKSPEQRWASANDMLAALEGAMPDCLDGSFEVKVSEYLVELMGHRSGERRKQLRLAEERADRGRPDLPLTQSTGSYGSLGAVYIDRSGSISSRSSQILRATEGSGSAPIPVVIAPAPASRFSKRAMVVTALLVGGPVLGFSLRQATHTKESGQASAVASPVPPATLSARPIVADLPITVTSGAQETAPSTSTARPEKETDSLRSRPARRGAAPARFVAPERAPAAISAPPASPPAQSAPAPKPNAAATPTTNAWDPDNFGGRR